MSEFTLTSHMIIDSAFGESTEFTNTMGLPEALRRAGALIQDVSYCTDLSIRDADGRTVFAWTRDHSVDDGSDQAKAAVCSILLLNEQPEPDFSNMDENPSDPEVEQGCREEGRVQGYNEALRTVWALLRHHGLTGNPKTT